MLQTLRAEVGAGLGRRQLVQGSLSAAQITDVKRQLILGRDQVVAAGDKPGARGVSFGSIR